MEDLVKVEVFHNDFMFKTDELTHVEDKTERGENELNHFIKSSQDANIKEEVGDFELAHIKQEEVVINSETASSSDCTMELPIKLEDTEMNLISDELFIKPKDIKHELEKDIYCNTENFNSFNWDGSELAKPNSIMTKVTEKLNGSDELQERDIKLANMKLVLLHEEVNFKEESIPEFRSREKSFDCPTCYKKLAFPSDLKMHIRTHTKEKPFECKTCNKKFAYLADLKMHIRIHTREKPFECKVCNRKFSRSGSLKVHLRTHTGEEPFECKMCCKRFRQSGSLSFHIRTHIEENHTKTHSTENLLECKSCNKKFTRSYHLKMHIKTHSGEKAFECKICNAKFTESGTLKRHLRIHSGEKPFECKTCNHKFTRSSNLKMHMRTHTGEKPFECNICRRKFNRNSNLQKHLRTHSLYETYPMQATS